MNDRITAISKKEHLNFAFSAITDHTSNFKNFITYSHCPITISELSQIACNFPIIFLKKENDEFYMASLFSLLNKNNPFINDTNKNYQWLGEYVPVFFRFYPFLLAKSKSGTILCFSSESSFIKSTKDEKSFPFFDDKGSLSFELKNILQILQIIEGESKKQQEAIAILDNFKLIKEWKVDIKLKEGEKKIEGMYKIDEKKLNSLPIKHINELYSKNAFKIAYSQLISMPKLNHIAKLHTIKELGNQKIKNLRDVTLEKQKVEKKKEIDNLVKNLFDSD